MTTLPRILVIDDDPLFRSLTVALLRNHFDIVVASDGAEGFQKALQRRPDIAVIDLQMPVWDGLKTLRAFRRHPRLAKVKLVMLSSDASRDSVLAAIEAGAVDYLVKTNLSKPELLQKLKSLLPQSGGEPDSREEVPDQVGSAEPSNELSKVDQDPALQDILDGWE